MVATETHTQTEMAQITEIEKENIDRFYKDCFNREIPWIITKIPEHPKYLSKPEYVFSDIPEHKILQAYAAKFGDKSIDNTSHAFMILENIGNNPIRHVRSRLIFHSGQLSPETKIAYDPKHPGVPVDEEHYMTAREALIAAFRQRFETKELYDTESGTRLKFTTTDQKPLYLYHNHGKLFLRNKMAFQRDVCGIRKIKIFKR